MESDRSLVEVYLARHGETEWSVSGQHTGRTDIPLLERGGRSARALHERLAGIAFDHVFTSPLERARRTCELAGFADRAALDPDLMEWDYGAYEGLTAAQIRQGRPGWEVFEHGCPDGESVRDVTDRADRVVQRLTALQGRVLLFGHGHFSRALGTRWIGRELPLARHLALSAAAVSVVGYEESRDCPAILLWNDTTHLAR